MHLKPGSKIRVPKHKECDTHSDRLAVQGICGEVDSFGHEEIFMCGECYTKYEIRSKKAGPVISTCEWCNAQNVAVKPTRDYDEGSAGRLYDVCQQCREDQEKSAQEDADYLAENRDDSEIYYGPEDES